MEKNGDQLTKLIRLPLRATRRQDLFHILVPHEEREIHIGALVAHQPSALGFLQRTLQHANDALDLIAIPLLGRGEFLGVEDVEPLEALMSNMRGLRKGGVFEEAVLGG